MSPERPQDISWLDGRINSALLEVVYIPGAADIRNENTNQEKATAVSKEDKIIEYIRQNGSISSQKAADIGGYKSKTGARKLLDKMIEKGLITKIGNGPATKYVI